MNSTASSSKKLVWLITGTSQGFGLELVRAALKRGDSVVATSRHPDKVIAAAGKSDQLQAATMNLLDEAEIARVVEEAVQRFGRIDVLVNNAGHGLLGAVEEASDAEVKQVYETNIFGLLRVTRAVLPAMRKQKSGHVVNISSIGGLVGLQGWGIYNSTKFAVEGLSEALALELAPLGIQVIAVEPGPFRTDFLGSSLVRVKHALPDYDPTAGQTRTYAENRHGKQQGDPTLAAGAIIEAVLAEKSPRHLLLGALAYDLANKKLDTLRGEFESWRELSVSTDFKE